MDFPDGRWEVRYKGRSMPYRTFDRLQRVTETAVLENKRIGGLLALIRQDQQTQSPDQRARIGPKRRYRTGYMFSVGNTAPYVNIRLGLAAVPVMAIYTTKALWTRQLLKAWAATTISLASVTSVNAADGPTWRLSLADISKMEPRLRLPERSYDLSLYARYYSGVIISGHHVIESYLIKEPGKKPGIYLDQPHEDIADGGCSIVTIYYDVDRGRMGGAACNGYA